SRTGRRRVAPLTHLLRRFDRLDVLTHSRIALAEPLQRMPAMQACDECVGRYRGGALEKLQPRREIATRGCGDADDGDRLDVLRSCVEKGLVEGRSFGGAPGLQQLARLEQLRVALRCGGGLA